ncbi:MAG: EamA family transporter, partial [Planctomycetota bacterium]|nr:EamA family transporter [Planctomycetota bacterium]
MSVPARAVLISIAIHTLWGGNPVALKFGLMLFPPIWSAFVRFSLAVFCIIFWARSQRISLRPTRTEWPALLLLGMAFTVQIAIMNIGFDFT